MLRLFRQSADGRAVGRVLGGDGQAFGLLVERYGRAAYAVARAIAPMDADADDVLQEAFVLAYRKLDTLEQPHRFGPWLISITRNVALRARERVRETVPLDAAPEAALATAPTPERAEIRAVVRQALERLEAEPREVLMLHYFAGASVADIAEMLNISTPAVKKRLQRARETLGTDLLRTLGQESDEAFELSARRRKQIVSAALAAGAAWQGTAHAAAVATAGTGAVGLALKATLALITVGGIATGAYWAQQQSANSVSNESIAPQTTTNTNDATAGTTDPALDLASADNVDAATDGPLPTGPCTVATTLKTLDGNVVPGAVVVMERITWKATELPPAKVNTWITNADAEGRVRFENLPAGDYSLIAYTQTLGGAAGFSMSDRYPVDESSQTLLMPIHELRGLVVDTAGKSVPYAAIYPIAHESNPGDTFSHWQIAATRAIAAEDGSFGFARMWPGNLKFFVYAEGYAPLTTSWTPTSSDATFTLSKGGALDITLVREPGGDVLTGIPVKLHDKDSYRIELSGKTDAQGKYLLDTLAPGDYVVSIEDPALVLYDSNTVTVEDGKTATATVRASAGATVLGTVRDSETGAPLPGLAVISQNEPQREAFTAADGTYMLVGVAPGEVTVSVSGVQGDSTRHYPGGAKGFEDGDETHKSISVKAGDNIEEIDFELKRALTFTGIVLDAAGQPTAGAAVMVRRSACTQNHRGRISLISDQHGLFEAESLPKSCQYQLVARTKEGMSPPLAITEADVGKTLTLRIDPSLGVLLAGSVVGNDGKPIPEGQVDLTYDDGAIFTGRIENGKVDFAKVPVGRLKYSVVYAVEESGFSTFRGCPEVDLELHAGAPQENFVFGCGERGELTISGVVLLPDGKPATGAQVRLMSEPQTATANHLGRFTLEGLKDSPYTLSASLDGYTPIEYMQAKGGDTDLSLQLQALARITGRVVDAATGAPVKATIEHMAFNAGGQDTKQIDADETGNFVFEKVFAGSGRLETKAPGYATNTFQYPPIAPGDDAEITVELRKPGRVAGFVYAPDGAPLEGATVKALPMWQQRLTRPDGSFEFLELEEGVPLTFEVSEREYGTKTVKTAPGAPGSDALQIYMEVPPILELNVTLDGAPVDHFQVNAQCMDGTSTSQISENLENAKGHFTTNKVTSGAWRLRVSRMEQIAANSYRNVDTLAREVVFQSGQTTAVNMDFETGTATLRATIVNEAGAAVPYEYAFLIGVNEQVGKTLNTEKTDAGLLVKNVSSGDYLLSIVTSSAAMRQVLRRVTLNAGEEKDIEIVIRGGASVTFVRPVSQESAIMAGLSSGDAPPPDIGAPLGNMTDSENVTAFFGVELSVTTVTVTDIAPGEYWLSTLYYPQWPPTDAPERTVQRVTVAPGDANTFQVGG